MVSRIFTLVTISCAIIAAVQSASIVDNQIFETPRINNGNDLIMSIVNNCFDSNVMSCLKGKVLTYLDTVMGLEQEQGRAFEDGNVDRVIFERAARILSTNEFRLQFPQSLSNAAVTFSADSGFDLEMPKPTQEEARGHMLKKKLLLPVLLLLKLKMKALMPIFVALIGIKAMKALVLSKIAITLVLGFILVQLLKKKGMEMPMMSMTPMMPAADPATAYGAPASATSAPDSSYQPGWEANSGGPYSRVWEPSSGSATGSNLAYSSYYPSSSSSSGSSSSISSGSSSSSASHTY